MNKNKGFTLIELLVVIAIIGVLASIVLGLLGASKDKGNDSKIVSQLKSMVNQAQLYNGTTTLVSWSENQVSSPPPVPGAVGLFWNTNAASNSLYRLANSLPAGTYYYYSTENKLPLAGGKWAFAAATSTGSFCVDYTGVGKTFTGPTMTTSNASSRYSLLDDPDYLCN